MESTKEYLYLVTDNINN